MLQHINSGRVWDSLTEVGLLCLDDGFPGHDEDDTFQGSLDQLLSPTDAKPMAMSVGTAGDFSGVQPPGVGPSSSSMSARKRLSSSFQVFQRKFSSATKRLSEGGKHLFFRKRGKRGSEAGSEGGSDTEDGAGDALSLSMDQRRASKEGSEPRTIGSFSPAATTSSASASMPRHGLTRNSFGGSTAFKGASFDGLPMPPSSLPHREALAPFRESSTGSVGMSSRAAARDDDGGPSASAPPLTALGSLLWSAPPLTLLCYIALRLTQVEAIEPPGEYADCTPRECRRMLYGRLARLFGLMKWALPPHFSSQYLEAVVQEDVVLRPRAGHSFTLSTPSYRLFTATLTATLCPAILHPACSSVRRTVYAAALGQEDPCVLPEFHGSVEDVAKRFGALGGLSTHHRRRSTQGGATATPRARASSQALNGEWFSTLTPDDARWLLHNTSWVDALWRQQMPAAIPADGGSTRSSSSSSSSLTATTSSYIFFIVAVQAILELCRVKEEGEGLRRQAPTPTPPHGHDDASRRAHLLSPLRHVLTQRCEELQEVAAGVVEEADRSGMSANACWSWLVALTPTAALFHRANHKTAGSDSSGWHYPLLTFKKQRQAPIAAAAPPHMAISRSATDGFAAVKLPSLKEYTRRVFRGIPVTTEQQRSESPTDTKYGVGPGKLSQAAMFARSQRTGEAWAEEPKRGRITSTGTDDGSVGDRRASVQEGSPLVQEEANTLLFSPWRASAAASSGVTAVPLQHLTSEDVPLLAMIRSPSDGSGVEEGRPSSPRVLNMPYDSLVGHVVRAAYLSSPLALKHA